MDATTRRGLARAGQGGRDHPAWPSKASRIGFEPIWRAFEGGGDWSRPRGGRRGGAMEREPEAIDPQNRHRPIQQPQLMRIPRSKLTRWSSVTSLSLSNASSRPALVSFPKKLGLDPTRPCAASTMRRVPDGSRPSTAEERVSSTADAYSFGRPSRTSSSLPASASGHEMPAMPEDGTSICKRTRSSGRNSNPRSPYSARAPRGSNASTPTTTLRLGPPAFFFPAAPVVLVMTPSVTKPLVSVSPNHTRALASGVSCSVLNIRAPRTHPS